jgi:hypothetical protein
MASFFKKALGVFVEFEEENKKETTSTTQHSNNVNVTTNNSHTEVPRTSLSQAEAEKFEKYFDQLMDKANLPGPDYYEFFKTMETLEAHIHDEKARLSATFASLSIQGLTKDKLIETAGKYKEIMEKDKANFEKALGDKINAEVVKRNNDLQTHEKKIQANSELIQKLTKEITEAQSLIGKLKGEIIEEENKLASNKNGYMMACAAVINKISSDIQKIQSTL